MASNERIERKRGMWLVAQRTPREGGGKVGANLVEVLPVGVLEGVLEDLYLLHERQVVVVRWGGGQTASNQTKTNAPRSPPQGAQTNLNF